MKSIGQVAKIVYSSIIFVVLFLTIWTYGGRLVSSDSDIAVLCGFLLYGTLVISIFYLSSKILSIISSFLGKENK